jgi:hypothetical protein
MLLKYSDKEFGAILIMNKIMGVCVLLSAVLLQLAHANLDIGLSHFKAGPQSTSSFISSREVNSNHHIPLNTKGGVEFEVGTATSSKMMTACDFPHRKAECEAFKVECRKDNFSFTPGCQNENVRMFSLAIINPCSFLNYKQSKCRLLKLNCSIQKYSTLNPILCDFVKNLRESNKLKAEEASGNLVNEKISCCAGGLCYLGKETECNMVNNSLLNTHTTENKGVFDLLSVVTRATGLTPDSIEVMNPNLCERCWKGVYAATIKDGEYQEDLKAVRDKFALSSSGDLHKKLELKMTLYAGYIDAYQKENPSEKNYEINCLTDTNIKKTLNNSCPDISNDKVRETFNYTKKDLSRLVESYNSINKYFTDGARVYDEASGKGSDIVSKSRGVFIKTMLNALIHKKENVVKYCNDVLKNNKDFKKSDFFNVILATGEGSSEEDLKRIHRMAAVTSILSPELLFLSAGSTSFCKLAIDGEKYTNLHDDLEKFKVELLGNRREKIEDLKNNLCPKVEDIVLAVCGDGKGSDVNRAKKINFDTFNSLSKGQQLIASEYICKKEAVFVSDGNDDNDDLLPGMNNTELVNGSLNQESKKNIEQGAKGKSRGSANVFAGMDATIDVVNKTIDQGATRRRNSVRSGQAIINNANLKEKGVTDSDLEQVTTSFDANPDFMSQMKQLTSSTSQPINNNQSMMNELQDKVDEINMEDIRKASQADPSIGSDIDNIADMINNSSESGIQGNINNPNQAIMDYITDDEDAKDSDAVRALKLTENASLRAELEALKQKINNEKTITSMASNKSSASKELEAARVRIKKLESVVSQMSKNYAPPVQINTAENTAQKSRQRDSGEQSINFSESRDRRGISNTSQKRGPASAQMPISSTIPASVQNELVAHAKSGIIFKNDKLVLVVDQTDYDLNIEEVVMKDGVVSGIKIQTSESRAITLSLDEMQEKSQNAVRKFIKIEGNKIIVAEKQNEKVVVEKLAKASDSYIQFLCSIHPDDSQCKK